VDLQARHDESINALSEIVRVRQVDCPYGLDLEVHQGLLGGVQRVAHPAMLLARGACMRRASQFVSHTASLMVGCRARGRRCLNDSLCPPFTSHGASIMLQWWHACAGMRRKRRHCTDRREEAGGWAGAPLTVSRHVSTHVCSLTLQSHLVDVREHFRRLLGSGVALTTEGQAAGCSHVGVNFHADDCVQPPCEACLTAGCHSHVPASSSAARSTHTERERAFAINAQQPLYHGDFMRRTGNHASRTAW
jgi:hypothetical protein